MLRPGQTFVQKKSRAKRATPKNRHRNMAAHSKISQLLTIIEWIWGGVGCPDHPPSLAPTLCISLGTIIPNRWRFMFQVFRKRSAYASYIFLAYEKEKCRQGDVFMVNDLCRGGRSVRVIEWEMLSTT